jgi:prepilin-type processing-associated H-X9-DG protein
MSTLQLYMNDNKSLCPQQSSSSDYPGCSGGWIYRLMYAGYITPASILSTGRMINNQAYTHCSKTVAAKDSTDGDLRSYGVFIYTSSVKGTRDRTLGLNSFVRGINGNVSLTGYIAIDKLIKPSMTLLLADNAASNTGVKGTQNASTFMVGTSGEFTGSSAYGFIRAWHADGRANVAYADGHAAATQIQAMKNLPNKVETYYDNVGVLKTL